MGMAVHRVDRLLLCVHYQTPLTDTEWQRCFELTTARPGTPLRAMIEVYGSVGPNAKQRNMLAGVVKTLDLRVAVLTDSLFTRGVVTAFAWFGVPISAFPVDQHMRAAQYLELTRDELVPVMNTLPKLRIEAGVRKSA